MFLETLAAATIAATLALVGNYLLLRFQTKTKVREERRAFVRELHAETVDLAVDLDLLIRSLRASAIAGTKNSDETARVQRIIETKWEEDLLRRVRRARFGHPDPEVRSAAERIDDDMWPFIVMAESPERGTGRLPPTKTEEERATAVRSVEHALVELRRSVYAAPHRDVPKIDYNGEEFPSRLWRALAEDREKHENDAKR
ncbi:MAG TPA: hypothetical protein VGB64_05535 [Actinomycetota bacterium]